MTERYHTIVFPAAVNRESISETNRMIEHTQTEYIHFLRLGDEKDEESINKLLAECKDEDIVFGNVKVPNNKKRLTTIGPKCDDFSLFTLLENPIPLSGALIKKDLFHKIGFFDDTLTESCVFDFFFKAIVMNNCTLRYVSTSVATCKIAEPSMFGNNTSSNEFRIVLDRYMPRLYGKDGNIDRYYIG